MPTARSAAPSSQPLPQPVVGGPTPVKVYAVGALAGTAAGARTVAPALPLLTVQQKTVEGIIAAFKTFFARSRPRQDAFIVKHFTGKLPQQMILDTVADETARQAEFERRVILRVRRDAQLALSLKDEAARTEAIGKLLTREQHYARFRAEAMAVRAFATLDRVVLKGSSPLGALWTLDPAVANHTPDCIAMAGKVWPWPVLDEFHPPTHSGCRCWLSAAPVGAVIPDTVIAFQRARAAHALLHEADYVELREALITTGLRSPGLLDRALLTRAGL